MTTPAYNALFLTPLYQIPSELYTPSGSGGLYVENLPLSNVFDRRLKRVARSVDALNTSTRLRVDLKADRQVRGVVLPSAYRGPDAPISSSGYVRVLGVPSTMLFDYEAGDDIVERGGTFTRTPTTNVRAATYIDRNGVLKYAGENLALQSAAFGTTWTVSNVTVSSNTVANPYDQAVTADTLTASAGNGTVIQDLGVLASAAFVFSVWLKRKTGSGNIQMTLDNGSTWTTKTLTTKWQRFYITQTLANPDCGIRIVTSGDAVYAWGAQAEHGTVPTGYVPTTSATNSAPRDGHFIGGYRHLLLEDARTNLCLQSENFGTTWATTGSPTRVAAGSTTSGVTLDLIGDDDAVTASEGYTQDITFTGDAVKAISIFVRQGSSTSSVIRLRDATAGADRLLAVITWSGTTPVVTMTTGTSLGAIALDGGVYRILLATTSVTAANTNSLQVYPATNSALANAGTGTLYAGGVQAENGTFPSSYIPTTSATVARSADVLSFPYTAVPQEMTVYVSGTDRGTAKLSSDTYLFEIGSHGSPSYIEGLIYNVGAVWGAHYTAAGSSSSQPAGSVSYLDSLEVRYTLSSAGAIQTGYSIASATEAVGSAGTARALEAAWSSSTLWVNQTSAGTLRGFFAYRSLRIAAGTKTMAEMRAIVYDSGWQNQYPTGATAETLAGMNVPHSLIIAGTQTAFRYCSVQIDDESNAFGYVDLGMVCIGGAYQPTINMRLGAQMGYNTDTVVSKTDGGSKIYTERPITRNPRFTVSGIPESEGQISAADMLRRNGISKQMVWFWNPTDTSADYLHRRSAILCTLKELNPIQFPEALYNEVAFELEEEL